MHDSIWFDLESNLFSQYRLLPDSTLPQLERKLINSTRWLVNLFENKKKTIPTSDLWNEKLNIDLFEGVL